jgi:excinuclease ABC subunit C
MSNTPDDETTNNARAPLSGTAATSDAVATGPAVIAAYVKTLPTSPGVYRMLNKEADVIYVGKARSLKARVSNYARLGGHTNRIARMIAATAAMEFVTVRTEAEALLLEANLIKRFRPRFNVLMRDDKSFPYILISRDHAAPQIMKHRGARNRKGDYFGPFASAGAVNRAINMLQRAFLLRTCSDSVFDSRTRPCLLFQIKRCAGPCTGEISDADYAGLVEEATRFLRGESQNVRQMYQKLMEEAAEALEFERAAKYRNRLWALAHVTSDQSVSAADIDEADVFAAHQEGGQTGIQVFFFRANQNWGNRAYYPRADRSLPVEEVLESFIAQFYDDKPVPRVILLSHDLPNVDLMAEALSTKAGRKVSISVPKRGGRRAIVEHALQNVREALARKVSETSTQRRLLEGVAERFGLDRPPRRIEVYDNSHIQGTNPVGAMIVAGPDGFAKSHYRKFNIKSETLSPGDDYGMMREVLTRRFKRLMTELADTGEPDAADATDEFVPPAPAEQSRVRPAARQPLSERGSNAIAFNALRQDKEDDTNTDPETLPTALPTSDEPDDELEVFPTKPDLVLIDGGAGQLAVAVEVFADLGITDIALVGVAKGPDRDAGREHFHMADREKSFMLEPRDPVLYYIQRLRDEAHRFAIGSHRARRSKTIASNPLDEIDGIGPTRKRALLSHFGSAKAVSRAGVQDLKGVPGISADMAQRIYDFFHQH